ncbi:MULTISPECIES: hypothetical protein [unclassified Nonomuraea]|uniref:hypothetical protein n=1 Tax=unclassified Nonomuraea TaxID=2593643 RepID=UPI0033F0E7CF
MDMDMRPITSDGRADLLMELLRRIIDLFQPTDSRAEQCLLELGTLLARPIEDAGRSAVSCRRWGRQWRIELAGRTVYVEHSVGMNHLALLLANPYQEISALELAAGSTLPGQSTGRDGESAQPVLDDLAKRRYMQRLSHLQAEIDELESMNDAERVAGVRAERDWLLDELAAATGLGERTRHFTGSAERARVAVGKAIRRTVNRIAEADPVIGDELRATVQTGMRCCYQPSWPRAYQDR